MKLKNRIQDYLETINDDSPGITCPACGSILGIRRQGSTEMVLTENARLELDGYLASYRRYLEKLELLLEQRNVYYKAYAGNYPFAREIKHYQRDQDGVEFRQGGVYKGVIAETVIEQLIKELDFFEWIENLYSFPRQEGEPQKVASQNRELIFQKTKSILISGLEPRSIAGSLMDLIFDQRYVAVWCEKFVTPASRQLLDKFLSEVCPAIQWYLQALRDINRQSDSGRTLLGQKSAPDTDLEEGIVRVQLILAIMLGHRNHQTDVFLKDVTVAQNVTYALPRKTVVSPKYLQELLCSEPVLGNPRIGINKELLKKLKQESKGFPNRNGNGDQATIQSIFKELRSEIYKFVHFTCTGHAGDQLNSDANQTKSNSDVTCGWYPKLEETHSVILLGSPGTGKSSVMLTGFTTFYDNVFALGATISFDSPEDEARMKTLNENYWVGKMPKPTPNGLRTTIKLSVEFPEKGYPRTHFVFTDIAGEIMAKSLTAEGSDPSVLRILKNAETIVFFFDVSIEPSIRKKLTEGDDGTWRVVEENFQRVRKSRMIDAAKNGKSESAAEVSQLQLLQKLIQDLRVQRGEEDLKASEINFICVIPKMDLFADEGNSERFFFTGFAKELKERDILVKSNRNRGDESLSGLRSLGGTLAKPPKEDLGSGWTPESEENNVRTQKQISKWVSRRTLHYLNQIGNALSPDTANPIKASLRQTLSVGLIATLHHVFGEDHVYFLPVSAQGKDSADLDMKEPPNQKLSEYVFILPVILSVADDAEVLAPAQPKRFAPW